MTLDTGANRFEPSPLGMYRCDEDYCLDVPFVEKGPCSKCGREFVKFTHIHVLRTGMQYTISSGHDCDSCRT